MTRTRGIIAAICASALSATPIITAQGVARDISTGQQTGTAAIAGVVVIDDNGRATPARHARVTLAGGAMGARSDPRMFLTSETGAFHFLNLPAGQYSISCAKDAYVSIPYGAKQPGRPPLPIPLANNQQLGDVTLHLLRGAVITGAVRDQRGQPAMGTTVAAMQFVNANGQRTLRSVGTSSQADDRGTYRIYGLPPGDYIVGVEPRMNGPINAELRLVADADLREAERRVSAGSSSAVPSTSPGLAPGAASQIVLAKVADPNAPPRSESGQPVGYAPVYYPGVASVANATKLQLAAGEEHAAVDFTIQLVPTSRIDGIVSGPDEVVRPAQSNAPRPQVTLIGSSMLGSRTMSVSLDPNGKFSFANLAPGDYVVTARVYSAAARSMAPGMASLPPTSTTLWASEKVSVNGDPVGVTLALAPPFTISGQAVFDVTTVPPPAPLTSLRLSLTNAQQPAVNLIPPSPAQVDIKGVFTIGGVTPGRYRLSVNAPPGDHQWWPRSAVLNGKDLLDAPFEITAGESLNGLLITFSDRPTELKGVLQDPAGNAPSYTLVIFSADPRYWMPASRRTIPIRPAVDGKFALHNLPAGDYLIAVVGDIDPGAAYDADLLQQLAQGAVRVTLKEGVSTSQDLKIGGGPSE